jgi:hypothetical protein
MATPFVQAKKKHEEEDQRLKIALVQKETAVTPKPTEEKKTYAGETVKISDNKTGTLKADGSVTPHAFKRLTTQEEADAERMKMGRPTSEQEQEQEQKQAELQAQLAQSERAAELGRVQEGTGSELDIKQVGASLLDPNNIKNTALTTIGGALAAAKIGALVGTPAGPAGTIAGAVAGLGFGVLIGVLDNIKKQKTDNLAEQKLVATQGAQNLNMMILGLQADPQNAEKYIDGYYQQKENIYRAYSNLKADTSSNLNLMLEQDGTRELARFELLLGKGGRLEYYDQKLQLALGNPNKEQALIELAMTSQSIEE